MRVQFRSSSSSLQLSPFLPSCFDSVLFFFLGDGKEKKVGQLEFLLEVYWKMGDRGKNRIIEDIRDICWEKYIFIRFYI